MTTNHTTSYYADGLKYIEELLNDCNTISLYILTLEEVSKQIHEDLYCVPCFNKLQILEKKTIINMIQQLKEKQFDKADILHYIKKSISSKILEHFED